VPFWDGGEVGLPNYFDEMEMGGRRREAFFCRLCLLLLSVAEKEHKKIFRIISEVVSEKRAK
jgi:hypothetical protein